VRTAIGPPKHSIPHQRPVPAPAYFSLDGTSRGQRGFISVLSEICLTITLTRRIALLFTRGDG